MKFETVRLGDICKTNQFLFSSKDKWNYVNYLDTGNITQNRICEIQYIDLTTEKLPSRAKRKVLHNSIIFSTVRPNQLHYGIIKDQPEHFLVSTGFTVIDVYPNKANADFIYYLLTQTDVIQHLQAIAEQSTSAYPSIKASDIEDLEIVLPNIATQCRISAILHALDEKIALNTAINENLEQQLHLMFVQMFSDSDKNVLLGDVIKTTSGGTPSRKHNEYYTNGTICWVKSKELVGSYIHDTEEYINNLAVSKSSAKLIPSHSVLIAMYGATVGAYGITAKAMTCNQAVCALLENKDYPFTYLYQIAYEQKQTLINLAVGSAQQNISQVLIKQLSIHSNTDIIKDFDTFARPLHNRIELLEAENKNLAALRDTLLPKLMSGEIDVSQVKI